MIDERSWTRGRFKGVAGEAFWAVRLSVPVRVAAIFTVKGCEVGAVVVMGVIGFAIAAVSVCLSASFTKVVKILDEERLRTHQPSIQCAQPHCVTPATLLVSVILMSTYIHLQHSFSSAEVTHFKLHLSIFLYSSLIERNDRLIPRQLLKTSVTYNRWPRCCSQLLEFHYRGYYTVIFLSGGISKSPSPVILRDVA